MSSVLRPFRHRLMRHNAINCWRFCNTTSSSSQLAAEKILREQLQNVNSIQADLQLLEQKVANFGIKDFKKNDLVAVKERWQLSSNTVGASVGAKEAFSIVLADLRRLHQDELHAFNELQAASPDIVLDPPSVQKRQVAAAEVGQNSSSSSRASTALQDASASSSSAIVTGAVGVLAVVASAAWFYQNKNNGVNLPADPDSGVRVPGDDAVGTSEHQEARHVSQTAPGMDSDTSERRDDAKVHTPYSAAEISSATSPNESASSTASHSARRQQDDKQPVQALVGMEGSRIASSVAAPASSVSDHSPVETCSAASERKWLSVATGIVAFTVLAGLAVGTWWYLRAQRSPSELASETTLEVQDRTVQGQTESLQPVPVSAEVETPPVAAADVRSTASPPPSTTTVSTSVPLLKRVDKALISPPVTPNKTASSSLDEILANRRSSEKVFENAPRESQSWEVCDKVDAKWGSVKSRIEQFETN